MERIMDTLRFAKKGKLTNSLQKFYIHSETIRNNQINEESTGGCNNICNVLTQHEHDRCRLPVTPQPAAGNHHLRPYRGLQFPNGNSKRKIKRWHAAPRHVQHTTVQLRTVTTADDSSQQVLELFAFILYIYI